MDYDQRKNRRIELLPPMPVKLKIIKHCGGNMTQFILDAVNEKIKNIENTNAEANKVSHILHK